MEENDLKDDEFMKELLKDLNVMKNVQGNANQYMYLTARENAQGRETSYNMNSQFDEDAETIVNTSFSCFVAALQTFHKKMQDCHMF